MLADIDWNGKPRKVMLRGNRNGFFYFLDRVTGQFLIGKAFIKETWALGIDKNGRPIKNREYWPKPMGGILAMPGSQGGTNWYPPSYDPETGFFYMSVWDNYNALSAKQPFAPWKEGELYNDAEWWPNYDQTGPPPDWPTPIPAPVAGGVLRGTPQYRTKSEGYGAIRTVDPKTGEKKWDFKMVNYTECGVLSPAGGLVFGGGMDGDFVALDATTGKSLWHANPGGVNASRPISYAANGKQYIISTGADTMYAFALPD
jgi:alcohol dehydrogenase (cytochrome c)